LYRTRLRWHGGPAGCGVARLHGASVPLMAAPMLDGIQPVDLDYVPEVGVRQIRRRPGDPMVDMTPREISDADALLHSMHRTAVSQ
jgi:hypothetical protein